MMTKQVEGGNQILQQESILFRHKVVRDLLWVLTSPHMICEHHFPVFPIKFGLETIEKAYPWLFELDQTPLSLIDFLQDKTKTKGKSLALGVYFAALFEFWLLHCPLFQVDNFVAGKQIVSSTNQTIGQLKFLFHLSHTRLTEEILEQNKQQKQKQEGDYHVEASVKFFMFHPLEEHEEESKVTKTFPLEVFVGPHLGENLAWRVQEVDRKLDMCQGQAVKEWLSVRYSDTVQSHIILKGYLFYPLKQFQDTLQVNSNGHAWSFVSPSIIQEPCIRSYDAKPNDRIGKTHLRGWWTCDLAKELATRSQWHSDKQRKYAVLPKLHWLSPTIGYNRGQTVIIEGEEALGIEEMNAMDYQELLTFADQHFQQEEVARNALVMPLLIAELLWIQEHERWEEISRGFVIDPKYWNPLPLCKEAVRYRRTTVVSIPTEGEEEEVDNTMPSALEREYEGRRKWQHGVIKLSEEEKQAAEILALQKTRGGHLFLLTQEEMDSISSIDLCERIAQSMAENSFSHSKWRKTIGHKLEMKFTNRMMIMMMIQLVLDMLMHLLNVSMTKKNELTHKFTTTSYLYQIKEKDLLRIGHLVLDALQFTQEQQKKKKKKKNKEKEENDDSSSSSSSTKACVDFFIDILKDENKWHFLNLSLRACGLTISCTSVQLEEDDEILSTCMWKLVQHPQSNRWNPIAVEMSRVFRLFDKDVEGRHLFLQTLLQSSEQNVALAEQFVLDHVQDLDLLKKYVQLLSSTNQLKAIKRLTKMLTTQQQSMNLVENCLTNCPPLTGGSTTQQFPPVNHELNRQQFTFKSWTWEYIHKKDQVDMLLSTLTALDSFLSSCLTIKEEGIQDKSIIGIDCEWRPQQFIQEQDDKEKGVSLYQLSIEDKVYVVDVQVLKEDAKSPLTFILQSNNLVLVGFCVRGDMQKLTETFPSLEEKLKEPQCMIELTDLAVARHLVLARTWGLSKLTQECLNEQVDKEQQCSDWGQRPLTQDQLMYAAKDAFAVQQLTLYLLLDLTVPGYNTLSMLKEHFGVSLLHDALYHLHHLRHYHYDQLIDALNVHTATLMAPQGPEHVKEALTKWPLLEADSSFHVLPRPSNLTEEEAIVLSEGTIVKSIALCIKKSSSEMAYAVVVLRLDHSIHMEALSQLFQVESSSQLVLADRETLIQVFGYQRGCLGPIGLRDNGRKIQIILDERLLEAERILCGAGEQDLVVGVTTTLLIETLEPVVAAISII